MHELLAEANSVLSSLSTTASSSFFAFFPAPLSVPPSSDSHVRQSSNSVDTDTRSGTTTRLSLIVIAGGCGVFLGWYGRAWYTQRRSIALARRESRQRNPLWLLPAPHVRRHGLSLFSPSAWRSWVAACVGQRWVPRLVWSPPLLHQCGVVYPVGSAEQQAKERAVDDAVRWGTRALRRLQGPVPSLSTTAKDADARSHRSRQASVIRASSQRMTTRGRVIAALQSRFVNTSMTSPFAWMTGGDALQWKCLPSYSVDVFICADAFSTPTTTDVATKSATATKTATENSHSRSCTAPPPSMTSLLCTPLWVLPRHTFALLYDPVARLSLWCGYHLTRVTIERARWQRRCRTVYTDRSLARSARRVPAEVLQRGYDRGHLAPHASVASTAQSAMEATLLTNIHLQHRVINRGLWRWLEAATRAYVKIPYDYDMETRACNGGTSTSSLSSSSSSSSSIASTSSTRVRKDGLLLGRLLAKETPFASLKDGQRVARRAGMWRWGSGEQQQRWWWWRKETEAAAVAGRQLCVNVGPLYCPAAPSHRSLTLPSARAAAADKHGRGGRTVGGKKRKAVCKSDDITASIPDAFFLSLWDAQTHHHLHLVIPNTPDTPAMRTLTQALVVSTCQEQQQRQQARRRRHHCRRHRRCAARASTQPAPAPARLHHTAATARSLGKPAPHLKSEAALEAALAAFLVSSEQLEVLFAESVVEVRRRYAAISAASHMVDATRATTAPSQRTATVPSSLQAMPHPASVRLRAPLRFFPVYHERWVWQTRWHRLAYSVSPKVLCFPKKNEPVTV